MYLKKSNFREITAKPMGFLDYSQGTELVSELSKERRDKDLLLRIDFSDIIAVDSSGIGALITLHKSLPQGSQKVVLENIPANVYRIFKMCNLDKIFNVDLQE